MAKQIINSKNAPAPIGPYSQAVLVDNTLYISGQIAIIPESGALAVENIVNETRQVMNNIHAILTEAGMDFPNVVKTTILLTDIDQFAKVNEVYAAFFQSDFPARETYAVKALPKGVHLEISMIAVK